MKPDAKPRPVWFAKNQVHHYADPTEPTKYPELYTKFYEASAYLALESENARLKDALGEGSGYMRLVVAFLTGCASSDKRFEQVLTLANKALEISSQALHGPREGE